MNHCASERSETHGEYYHIMSDNLYQNKILGKKKRGGGVFKVSF